MFAKDLCTFFNQENSRKKVGWCFLLHHDYGGQACAVQQVNGEDPFSNRISSAKKESPG